MQQILLIRLTLLIKTPFEGYSLSDYNLASSDLTPLNRVIVEDNSQGPNGTTKWSLDPEVLKKWDLEAIPTFSSAMPEFMPSEADW